MADKIYLIRHGETEWTISGQHTGTTDIPLTEKGKEDAMKLKRELQDVSFQLILSSPMQRAFNTCELAGFAKQARLDPDLVEWNYGEYEGLTTKQIWKNDPHWEIFAQGAPGGESVADVGARATHILAKLKSIHSSVALFSHGHFLRVLAARWLGLPPNEGRLFDLHPASISILGIEHQHHVIAQWNDTSYLKY